MRSAARAPTRFTAVRMSFFATARWTRRISLKMPTVSPRQLSAAISSEARLAARSGRTKYSFLEITRDSGKARASHTSPTSPRPMRATEFLTTQLETRAAERIDDAAGGEAVL